MTELRSLNDGERADAAKSSEFVTHLVVRNDHLRKFMSSAGADMVNGIADAIADRDRAKALLGLGGEAPSPMLAEQLDKAYRENPAIANMLGMSRQQFANWAFSHTKANFGEFHSQFIEPFEHAFGKVVGDIAETAAAAHRRSLGDTLSPGARVEKMKEFEWRVVSVATPLILPDCVAVATGAKGKAFPLLLEEEGDEADTLFIPLSSDRLLVGTKRSTEPPENLNEAFAECSWDFFIARDRTPELENLKQRIRSGASKQVQDTIRDALSGALEKF